MKDRIYKKSWTTTKSIIKMQLKFKIKKNEQGNIWNNCDSEFLQLKIKTLSIFDRIECFTTDSKF